jgi:DNA gyrase subunit A
MFATRNGYIRRNTLSDFADVKSNGKIAMKFEGEDADDRLIGVGISSDTDDVMLGTHNGRAIRFPVADVRVFVGRGSVGVRGVRLKGDDTVVSMVILRHMDATPEIREAYLAEASRRRKAAGQEGEAAEEAEEVVAAEPEGDEPEAAGAAVTLSEEQFAALAADEQILLSVTENGYGMRTSAYDYRIIGRGGQGVFNVAVTEQRGKVVSVLRVDPDDEIILVTDGGMVIRTPIHDIRMVRRNKLGVRVFKVHDGEHVVSVARLTDAGGDSNGDAAAEPDAPPEAGPETGDQ